VLSETHDEQRKIILEAQQHAPLIRIWTRARVFPPTRLLRFRRAAGKILLDRITRSVASH